MMSEMDANSSTTTRLRRRSFYEGMEMETSSNLDTVALNEKDLTASASTGYNNDSTQIQTIDSTSSAASAGTPVRSVSTGSRSLLQLYSHWFPRHRELVRSGVDRVRAWGSHRLTALRLRLWWPLRSKAASESGVVVVRNWWYPTYWITFGCFTLLVMQIVMYWSFQSQLFDLEVQECAFHERVLPEVLTTELLVAVAAARAATLAQLDRRFEQQYGAGVVAQHNRNLRLPMVCMTLVPSTKEAQPWATKLAFHLPRSQVMAPESLYEVGSRLEVVIGSEPVQKTPHSGLRAALFSLSSLDAFQPSVFPEIVLVQSEFALHKMLKYRQERRDAYQQNIQELPLQANAVAPAKTATTAPAADLISTQFAVFLLKTMVPDIYDRKIRKNWDTFLHVVVTSEQDKKEQYTEDLLSVWLQHPEWPVLHVRFANSLTLCGSFQRLLTSLISADQTVDPDAENQATPSTELPANIHLSCTEAANTPEAIRTLKNQIGMHLFPVPPEMEIYQERVLDSAAVGAMVLTYNSPLMQEWVPENAGLRVGTSTVSPATVSIVDKTTEPTEDGKDDETSGGPVGAMAPEMVSVHVTQTDIENGVKMLLSIDRVNRVAAGRAARVHYLQMRAHYLSALAALDKALCEANEDEYQHEIGSRSKIDVATLRAFIF